MISKSILLKKRFYYSKRISKAKNISIKPAIFGKQKQFSPANLEWKNAIYSFNNENLKNLTQNTKIIDKLILFYFNLISNYEIKTTSKAKRVKIINKKNKQNRNTLNKILIGKTEVKHYPSKSIVNLYYLNNEKKTLVTKANKILIKNKLVSTRFYKNYIVKTFNENLQYKNNVIDNLIISDNLKSRNTNKNIWNRKSFLKNTAKLRKVKSFKATFLKYEIVLSVLRKKIFLKTVFMYSFLKWVLRLFNINVKLVKKTQGYRFNKFQQKVVFLVIITKNSSFLLKTYKLINAKYFLNDLNDINYKLTNLLLSIIKVNSDKTKKVIVIAYLFEIFKNKYYLNFLKKHLKKELVSLKVLTKLHFNNLKFTKLVLRLKQVLTNVFNKKVELNLVSLKYIYMNTDIFMQALAIKLKGKSIRLLRSLKRALRLVKKSKGVYLYNKTQDTNIKYLLNNSVTDKYKNYYIELFRKIPKISKAQDSINYIINNVFHKSKDLTKTSLMNKKTSFNLNVLNAISYKWTKGIRLEVKGRLTKRKTASRALFKYKYLGSLKDHNICNISKYSLTRGYNKSNTNYSVNSSKRRIGSFGIKGWIGTI